jgi:uncharacterized protein YdeI (BOF family)
VAVALTALLVDPTVAASPPYADPSAKPDRSFISLTGDVVESGPDRFRLDYGEGTVTVEMDDWDWYDEASLVRPGDRVTVYGRIDHDVYEKRTIEADSVYVFGRSTFYYASDVDEEDVFPATRVVVADGARMTMNGRVTKIEGREFVLEAGGHAVRVDTILMEDDPLDEVGAQRIRIGDRVSVSGRLDPDFFEKSEVRADTIVTFSRDGTKKRSKPKD